VSLVSLANSRLGPPIGIAAAGLLPRGFAYRLGEWIARRVAAGEGPLPSAVRLNQAVVRGMDPHDPALHRAVEVVLRTAAVGYVDLFKAMAGGPRVLRESCELDPQVRAWVEESIRDRRGMIAVSGHLSCFDMILLSLAQYGYPIQGLSYAQPRGSYLVQNAIRLQHGLDLSPISPQALRKALHLLKAGGIAMTAVDRPVDEGELLELFGRPARLPVGHARLAIMAKARVMVGVCQSLGEGKYRVVPGGLLDSTKYERHGDGPRRMAQDVLAVLEPFIRARPEEWLMFHPLWPDIRPEPAL